MDEQLPGRLRDVQVIFKEFVDGEQRLLIEGVDGILLEHLGQEDLAERRRQLIDEPPDAQVFIVDDGLLRVEHLADLNGDLCLLVGVGQLAQVARHGADADHRLDEKLRVQRLLDLPRDLEKILLLSRRRDLLDDGHVLFIDGEDEILLPVREHARKQVHHGHVGPADLPHQEHRARHVRHEMKLLRADIHVARQDVVRDDVLHERAFVVFFFIIGLRAVQRHISHHAQAPGGLVVALGKHGVIEIRAPGHERLERLLVHHHDGIRRTVEPDNRLGPFLADHRRIAARDDVCVGVDHADHAVGGFFHLNDNTLKNAAGHRMSSLS